MLYELSVWWSWFKYKSFLQGDSNIFGGCGLVYLDSQSNCRILWKAIYQERLDGLFCFCM